MPTAAHNLDLWLYLTPYQALYKSVYRMQACGNSVVQ